MKYNGNGGGRDTYIIHSMGGHTKEGTFESKPKLKIDRLFGRLPDQELSKMYIA